MSLQLPCPGKMWAYVSKYLNFASATWGEHGTCVYAWVCGNMSVWTMTGVPLSASICSQYLSQIGLLWSSHVYQKEGSIIDPP